MPSTSLNAVFTFGQKPSTQIGERRIRLLEAVRDQGSIAAAGRAVGLSYKAAWDAVNTLNNLFAKPLIIARAGGRHGGNAYLTLEGETVIRAFYLVQTELSRFFDVLERRLDTAATPVQPNLLWRLFMKTSARNALNCTVKDVTLGAVNAEVLLQVTDAIQLSVIITKRSVQDLGLTVGKEVTALIKSSFVILTPADQAAKTSARNRLCGTVVSRDDGAVNSEIGLDIGGGKVITAIVTMQSVADLGLQVGSPACALIKASHIILAVD
ncbi:MAG: TOBE domain-containing protein [Gammaproteobacteria bacterium]|nr:TOBE domain-containing protein [Gammaproteobacteria bacterium]MCP5458089.1 TOBE domain-containing protein [Gammaproteobacteria bacterium]